MKISGMAAKQNTSFLFGGHHCLLNNETPHTGFVFCDTAKCHLSLSSEDLNSEDGLCFSCSGTKLGTQNHTANTLQSF